MNSGKDINLTHHDTNDIVNIFTSSINQSNFVYIAPFTQVNASQSTDKKTKQIQNSKIEF